MAELEVPEDGGPRFEPRLGAADLEPVSVSLPEAEAGSTRAAAPGPFLAGLLR